MHGACRLHSSHLGAACCCTSTSTNTSTNIVVGPAHAGSGRRSRVGAGGYAYRTIHIAAVESMARARPKPMPHDFLYNCCIIAQNYKPLKELLSSWGGVNILLLVIIGWQSSTTRSPAIETCCSDHYSFPMLFRKLRRFTEMIQRTLHTLIGGHLVELCGHAVLAPAHVLPRKEKSSLVREGRF